MPSRILLIQLRRIGDVLMTTPALAALRAAYPEARISYLTEAPSDQIFTYNPHLDEVIVYPRKASLRSQLSVLRRLRGERYDLALDFFSNPRTAFITRFTGARRRIGFRFPGRAYAYTDAVHPAAEGPRYAALHKAALLEPLGIRINSPLPQVFLGRAERRYAAEQLHALGVRDGELLVALSPVSRQPYKVWPAKHFARLADSLIQRYDAKVLLVWGPGERHFADAVRLEMRQPALPDYPVPSLLEMGALLERAHLYLGNDNGPRHFAVALGTPTVTVFGRPYPENWTPPAMPMHRTIEYDPGCKASCTYPRCSHLNCINAVPYQAVQAETEAMLKELGEDGRLH